MMRQRVIVVGAGAVGAAIAWRCARSGAETVLVDPHPRGGASWVAGGMLAPVTEAWPGEDRLLELGIESLGLWPWLAEELIAAGHDPGLRTEGTVVGVVDIADRDELRVQADYLARLGREVALLTGRELRALEPSLGPAVRAGLSVPGDLAVDNRRLLDGLLAVGAEAGVTHRAVAATAVRTGAVDLATGETLAGDTIVLAAGAWSGTLHPGLRGVIRPVKGEIVRLRTRSGSLPPPVRTVRGLVEGRHLYLVPRDHGGLVLGATQYEAGFDTEPRVAGLRDLLADAERLVPGVADYAVAEVAAGLRPGSQDNLPVVRWLEPGVLAATGHGRNGMLLLPGTVAAVSALIGATTEVAR